MPFEHVYPQKTVFLFTALQAEHWIFNKGKKTELKTKKCCIWTTNFIPDARSLCAEWTKCWIFPKESPFICLKSGSRGSCESIHYNMEINIRILYNKCNMYHIFRQVHRKKTCFLAETEVIEGTCSYSDKQFVDFSPLTQSGGSAVPKALKLKRLDPLMSSHTPASATIS